MSDDREGPIKVHATHAYVGQTADGDVIFQMSKPPPEGVGVRCRVDGCGAYNWPHAKICHNCLKDFGDRRRFIFRATIVLLLVLIAIIDLVIVQRI
jgi:hypothetical protein